VTAISLVAARTVEDTWDRVHEACLNPSNQAIFKECLATGRVKYFVDPEIPRHLLRQEGSSRENPAVARGAQAVLEGEFPGVGVDAFIDALLSQPAGLIASMALPKVHSFADPPTEKAHSRLARVQEMYDIAVKEVLGITGQLKVACDEHAERAGRYSALVGKEEWIGLERRHTRSEGAGEGAAALFERERLNALGPPANLRNLSLYTSMKPHWDIYKRPYVGLESTVAGPIDGPPAFSGPSHRPGTPSRGPPARPPTPTRGAAQHRTLTPSRGAPLDEPRNGYGHGRHSMQNGSAGPSYVGAGRGRGVKPPPRDAEPRAGVGRGMDRTKPSWM
jgi:hypothetical protein